MNSLPTPKNPALGRKVRAVFGAAVEALLEPLGREIRARLQELVDRSESSRQAHERRDALVEFDRLSRAWTDATTRALRELVGSSGTLPARAAVDRAPHSLSLIDDAVVEKKILASRLAMAVQERLGFEYNDIALRIEAVDGLPLGEGDLLRPEVVSALVVDHWLGVGISRGTWLLVTDVIQQAFTPAVTDALRAVNKALLAQGVLPSIDLSQRVRRGAAAPARSGAAGAAAQESGSAPLSGSGSGPGGFRTSGGVGGGASGTAGWGSSGSAPAGGVSSGSAPAGGGSGGSATEGGSSGGGSAPAGSHAGRGGAGASFSDEASVFGRARARAQGIVGQMRQMLAERLGGTDAAPPAGASRALSQAIGEHADHVQTQVESRQASAVQSSGFHFDNELVQEVASDLRSRTRELKRQAATPSEKAVIEIVALIFQSILAEDRIPASVRLWFARLQMPVLRIALAEPEFFETLQHPARQLIDRMGACVLGFDASRIGGSALEAEIRRLVQMIEQYPDAGRRAFELAYTEFQAFLAHYLTGSESTQRAVSVAQQVEQKEIMAVRYTIELRKMLEDVPVRDEIREFLFKVWTEVLAVAAVRQGPQHEGTQALRRSASELVWAASAKPSRAERTQVIQQLPQLLQNLRQGMSLMGLDAARQEAHIKVIGDTLADAFQSKTAAIPRSHIDAIAERLASIEDFVGDDPEVDLPLVAESIEMMLGLDNEGIQVVTDGGATPNAAMQAWAREMEPGNWFKLEHNGQAQMVQYAWRSERGQLHLFALADGRSYLFQASRLAAYLQAALLSPIEDEALTVRATRDALARLDANPERLLGA